MAKIQLTPIGSFTQSAITTINANMDRIATTLDSLLSRDGTTPNQLVADLDLNDNDLLNVGICDVSKLFIDGVQWAGDDVEVVQGPQGEPGEGWAPVFGIVTDGARRVLILLDYIGGVGTKPTTYIGQYVGTSGYVSLIASAVDIRGPQGTQGAAGSGSGDMLEAMYDPNGVNDDAFDMDNMVETVGSKIMTAAERIKLSSLTTVDASSVETAGAVMETDTSTSSMAFVVNENNMTSNSATKVPTQASVKSYVDSKIVTRTESLIVAASDESTAISAGTGKVTFRMPYALTLTAVRASLTTAQGSGSIFTVDINKNGTSIISTKLTIDNTEKTSTTAATPVVIANNSLADDDEITVDVDQIGNGTAKGLKIYLIGTR